MRQQSNLRAALAALGLSLLATGVGCGGSDPSTGGGNGDLSSKDSGVSDASKPKPTDAGKKDSGGGSSTTDSGPTAINKTGLAVPDEVCAVLQNNGCINCHTTPTVGGAPMALQMRDDFAGNAADGTPLAARLLERVADGDNPMPPASTGSPLMSADDLATMTDWISGGMKGVAGGKCGASDAGVVAPVTWNSGIWPEDECETVLTLGAHGAVGTPLAMDPTGFPIPADETHYECFYEYVPWGDKPMQALAIRARVESDDDLSLVHHFVVSSSTGLPSVAGQVPTGPGDHKPCENPSGSTVGIWAPGATNPLAYPSDVGVIMPGTGGYMELQIHYNNPNRVAGKQSRAQYDICVSSKVRPQTAGTFWLGYENAFYSTLVSGAETTTRLDNQNNGTAIGKCAAKERTRILTIMPHMHQGGRHAKLEIVHANGMPADSIVDAPFNFMDQASYLQDELWVEKGDTVRSTCTWDKGPKYFGFGSEDEMCFFYVVAYPLAGLTAGFGEKGFVGGDLGCAAAVGP